jgi:VIT1/CCC1 family predicted Fe2+/Mn2+ transporter
MFIALAATVVAGPAAIAALVGALLPIIIGIINDVKWSKRTQSIAAFITCFIAAVITTLFSGEVMSRDLVETFGIIYGAAMVSYHGLFKPTGAAETIEKSVLPREKRSG